VTASTSNEPTQASADGPASDPTAPGAELADDVVAAVVAVPGVAAMHSGRFGEVATYLPGRRVAGVRVRADLVEVHVTANWGSDLLPLADAIRLAAASVASRTVHVVIQDVLGPIEDGPATEA